MQNRLTTLLYFYTRILKLNKKYVTSVGFEHHTLHLRSGRITSRLSNVSWFS